MHNLGIIHRDLKLDNILLNSKEEGIYDVRIADFGLAKQIKKDEVLYNKCGSPTYIAPEILLGQGYTLSADIFSLGSVMFNLAAGRYLF
jgi:serine/threonine protein kinase